ncbi:SPOR domain-containing protein [Ramlibacter rhizophilus]|uniref:SPOR domain-containing protein n=1 Tax=Ramlibacter rhizophilus TaxID=1781167 RepID=A0A4Z0BMF0_9BURK|nr:SPOR domain-containing protein [Ramlibacter rhizophilus]TFY99961.1 SPOR domain-containing protein [Ramlibacter rhizophilus]
MAFFKFRKGEGATVARPAPSESVEAMRRRARQRLMGAAVLVLAGIIGFPLLFDTQPRPVAVDIPIEIPDRQRAAPLAAGTEAAGAVTPAPATSGGVASPAATPPAAPASEPAKRAVAQADSAPPAPAASPARPAAESRPGADAKPAEPKPAEPKPAEPKPATRAEAAADEAARARALLEGRAASAVAAERYVVQVGAFAEAGKAREVRQRLERAGVKTYVHVAQTAEGPRIRVRVGPFTQRAEADKAAQKIKGLELPAAVLTL